MSKAQTLSADIEKRFDDIFCSSVGGSLQTKGLFDVGFGTSPEVMPQVKAFLATELSAQKAEMQANMEKTIRSFIAVRQQNRAYNGKQEPYTSEIVLLDDLLDTLNEGKVED